MTNDLTDDQRLHRMRGQVMRMKASIEQMLYDMKDNPVIHLRPCRCGRQWTRLAVCVICAAEISERAEMTKAES